jgi:hypothetical protein
MVRIRPWDDGIRFDFGHGRCIRLEEYLRSRRTLARAVCAVLKGLTYQNYFTT